MISIDFVGPDRLRINIIKDSFFQEELQKVKDIPGRVWNHSGYWEFPWYQLGDVLEVFPKAILKSPTVQDLDRRLTQSLVPWRKAGSFLGEIKFSKPPKPHQEKYIRITPQRNRLLNSLEQGLGKTLSSLERVKFLGYKRLLIVCPKVVCANWRAEIREALGEVAPIYLGTNVQRPKKLAALIESPSAVTICTYETVGELSAALASGKLLPFDQLIIDEAHLLSNPESKRFLKVKEMVSLNKKCGIQCLSGTPMQHRIKDMWAIIHILNPLLAGGYEAFAKRFMRPIRWMNRTFPLKNRDGSPKRDENGKTIIVTKKIETAWRPQNLHLFEKILEAISFRAKREDVTDFKDAMEIVTIELTSRQRRMYEKVADALMFEVQEKQFNLRHLPVRLLRLLQASEGLFNFDAADMESGKLDYIRHALDNTDEKIIVWSRFRPITEILGKEYADRCVVYNGSRSDNYKQFAKWAFNGCHESELEEYRKIQKRIGSKIEPGEAQFFFGTIDMRSSLGMNLHSNCSRQIFSSFSWSGAANMQAADRLRRIGQTSERVLTEFLVGEDTFELHALNVVMRNFQDTLEALDGKDKMSFKQISQMIQILKEARR